MKFLPLSALSLALAASSPAAVLNGDFSNPLTTGWSTLGDVSIITGAAFLTTASLTSPDDAPAVSGSANFSGVTAEETGGPSGPEVFSGLAAGGLDPNRGAGVFAFEASVIKQTFSVLAGDILSFDWQLFTNEGANADYAYLTINGALTVLGRSADALAASSPFANQNGVATFTQAFSSAGSVTVAFGIVDTGDFNNSSALRLDNVMIVPEPTVPLFGLVTVGALGLLRRRN